MVLVILQNLTAEINITAVISTIFLILLGMIGWFSRSIILDQEKKITALQAEVAKLRESNNTEIDKAVSEIKRVLEIINTNKSLNAEQISLLKDHVNNVFFKLLDEIKSLSVKVAEFYRNTNTGK